MVSPNQGTAITKLIQNTPETLPGIQVAVKWVPGEHMGTSCGATAEQALSPSC